jgi:hypothetical protein
MEYNVITGEKPTFFNKEAALGMMLGLLIPVPGLNIAAGAAIGTALGAITGRVRMSRELTEGKPVKEPSLFNMKTVIGALAGAIAVGFVVALAAPVFTGGAAASAAAIGIGHLTGILIGGYMGGKRGEADQMRDYMGARQAAAAAGVQYTAGMTQTPQQDLSVAPTQEQSTPANTTSITLPATGATPPASVNTTTIVAPDATAATPPQITNNNTTVIHTEPAPIVASAQADNVPVKSFTDTLATERNQPAVQGNART